MTQPSRLHLAAAFGVFLTACGPGKLADLQGLQIFAGIGGTLEEPDRLVIELPYDHEASGCLIGGNVTITLNGNPITVYQGHVTNDYPYYNYCNSPLGVVVVTAEDRAIPEAVIEATDGSVFIRTRVQELLTPWTFALTEPQDGVLHPGTNAVITWSPATDALPELTCEVWGCPAVVEFGSDHYSLGDWQILSDQATVSANTIHFQVPLTAMADTGYLFVSFDKILPAISECTGVPSCSAELSFHIAKFSVPVTIAP